MLEIFIRGDSKDQRQSIERIVKNCLMMVDLDARLEPSTDLPSDILRWRTQEQHDYSFLLDIELNHEMNGIILAFQLRESYLYAKIVFTTSHTEMTSPSFLHKVEALDFIQKKSEEELKPEIVEVINATVDRISKFSPDKREFILIRSNYTDTKLVIDDILFFETTPIAHKLGVHLLNR